MKVQISPFDDCLHEECGVFGVFGDSEATYLTALGLHALQHRGQEAAGIAANDGKKFHIHKRPGLVGQAFGVKNDSPKLQINGTSAIGHVRYSTAGGNSDYEIQPFLTHCHLGEIALAHNGNLTNADVLRKELLAEGQTFQSTSDTEAILQMMANSRSQSPVEALLKCTPRLEGAYALVVLGPNELIGARDPSGVRPLVLGKLDDIYMLASETCAFDQINAEYVRDIEPGEVVCISEDGVQSYSMETHKPERFCIFEYVYFMRPNSEFQDRSIAELRENMGAELAKESPVEADMVIPVPDSGIHAAIGFAEESKIPYKHAILRSHYTGRTFIEPTQQRRDFGVRMKLSVSKRDVKGKRVVLVDDSVVRGTTMPKIVHMMRDAGAKEIHIRIPSPTITHSCFYGVDTPDRDELTANHFSIEEMAKEFGADSLAFISNDGLYRAIGFDKRDGENRKYCDACFTGDYPIELTDFEAGNASRGCGKRKESAA